MSRAVEKIVRDVRRWPGARVEEDVLTCLEVLLDSRDKWLECSDPTLWKTGDVHRLLNEAAAARLTDRYGMDVHAPEALRTLVDFLDETDRFHPSAMRAPALRKELDRAAVKFPARMADESGWQQAKRLFMAMRADGVDLTDDTAVGSWTVAFNEAPDSRRQAVLGTLLERDPELRTARFVVRGEQVAAVAPGDPIPPEFADAPGPAPPVALPPLAELAARTRETPLLRNVVACGQWAGTGRKVTRQGFLAPAETRTFAEALDFDVPDGIRGLGERLPLIRAWRVALDVEALQLHRTQVVAGPASPVLEAMLDGRADLTQALETWREIADVAITDSAALDRGDRKAFEITKFCRPWGPRALGALSRAQGDYDLDTLVDDLIDQYEGHGLPTTLVVLVGAAVRGGILAAFEAGVVSVSVPPDADVPAVAGDPRWAMTPIPGTTATLTPLGSYFVRDAEARTASDRG